MVKGQETTHGNIRMRNAEGMKDKKAVRTALLIACRISTSSHMYRYFKTTSRAGNIDLSRCDLPVNPGSWTRGDTYTSQTQIATFSQSVPATAYCTVERLCENSCDSMYYVLGLGIGLFCSDY